MREFECVLYNHQSTIFAEGAKRLLPGNRFAKNGYPFQAVRNTL